MTSIGTIPLNVVATDSGINAPAYSYFHPYNAAGSSIITSTVYFYPTSYPTIIANLITGIVITSGVDYSVSYSAYNNLTFRWNSISTSTRDYAINIRDISNVFTYKGWTTITNVPNQENIDVLSQTQFIDNNDASRPTYFMWHSKPGTPAVVGGDYSNVPHVYIGRYYADSNIVNFGVYKFINVNKTDTSASNYFNQLGTNDRSAFKIYPTQSVAYFGLNNTYGITVMYLSNNTFNTPSTTRISNYVANIEDFVLYNQNLYVSYASASGSRIYKYNKDCTSVTLFITPTSAVSALHIYGGNLYAAQYNSTRTSININIYELPTTPSNIQSIDSDNTVTVTSGNLKVTLIDTANKGSNNVFYYYSLNNASFINSNVQNNGPSQSTYFFYVTTSNILNTLYVYAYNSEGVSNTISRPVTVYQTPRQPSSYTVSYFSSGNINVSVTETSPISNYNLNGVSYWYYLYTTGTNQFSNISAYSQGANMNSSYTTNFVIQNIQPNNYRVYLLARNTVGNSTPVLSTSANVTVFTTPSSPNSYSLSFDELSGITVSITDTRNVAQNQVYYHYYYYRIGDTAPNQSADINVYANSYVPVVNGQTSYSFNIKGLQTSYYNVYIAAKNSVGGNIYTPLIEPVNVICFKEDSRILTNRGYRKIQYLKQGDLVKTFKDGFKPIYKIGKKEIMHVPSLENRTKDQLYKCSPTEYPELFEDLVLTGCHSILVDEFVDEEQRTQTRQINGGIYVTDKKYRLPVCVDQRASVYEKEGKYSVYHIALENDDYYMNYGIYANGLLVESTSKRFLDEYKVMDTQYSNRLTHNKIYTS